MRLFLVLVALALSLAPTIAVGQVPAEQVVHFRGEYTLANGKKVVIEESGDAWRAEKAAASPAKSQAVARCTTCGNACDCGEGCICNEMKAKALAAKAAAPKRYYLPAELREPEPVVYSGLPAWSPTAGGYYQGVYYQPMPATIQSPPVYASAPVYGQPVYGAPVYAGADGACANGQCGTAQTRGMSFTGPFGGGFRYGSSYAGGK